jgi:hypothetical protein
MLTARADTQDLIARLNAVPAAVQQAVGLVARAAAPSEVKAAAIRTLAERARDRRLQPDRKAALARLSQPARTRPPLDVDHVRQAAVQAALTALGRA